MKRSVLALFSALALWAVGAGLMTAGAASAADATYKNPFPTGDQTPAPVCIAMPLTNAQKASGSGGCPAGQYAVQNDPNNGGAIFAYLKFALTLLNMLVGAIIVLMLVIAGFQYMASAGDPNTVKKAKARITNAITALILYMLMFAILNFLVPGGLV